MDGGGSEQQILLLLRHLNRTQFQPELYLLRRTGSLLDQVPNDVPVHCFEDRWLVDGKLAVDSSPQSPPSDEVQSKTTLEAAGKSELRLGPVYEHAYEHTESDTSLPGISDWATTFRRVRSVLAGHFNAWMDGARRLCDRVNWPGKIHRAQVRHLTRLLKERQIDVVYDRTFLMTLIAAPAAAKVGVPRVSTIVSPPSRIVPLNGGRFLAAKRRRLRIAYASAAAVVAVSRPTAHDAASYYGLPRQRFRVIPNPVDSDTLDTRVANTPRPLRDHRWTIACVGRMSVEKGQATLVEALDRLRCDFPDFPLPVVWMIGDGELRSELEQSVESLGLQHQFRFLGHLAQPAPWIAAADALCLPSHFEGFPNVMLEAMALGTPVIARSLDVIRSLGSLPQQADIRGRDYLAMFTATPGEDARSLAKKIRRVQLNTAATRSRVKAARRLARDAHAISHLLPRIEYLLLNASANSWQRRQRG